MGSGQLQSHLHLEELSSLCGVLLIVPMNTSSPEDSRTPLEMVQPWVQLLSGTMTVTSHLQINALPPTRGHIDTQRRSGQALA